MTHQQIIQQTRPDLEKTLEFFKRELGKLRTGQASPALVEDLAADVYGQALPLKQLGGISIPERRQIVIQPWDPSYLGPIEKALQKAALGASPIIEKDQVRITLPPLTQEYRATLGKVLAEKTEQTKQTLRKAREEAWTKIQEAARTGEIREDDKFKGKEDLQKLLDEYQAKVDELAERKKQELEA